MAFCMTMDTPYFVRSTSPARRSRTRFFSWIAASVLAVAVPRVAAAQAGAPVDPAQVEVWDVVQTTDGNVLKGVIVEQTRTATGIVYKLVLPGGGGTVTIPENKVARITKEQNPTRSGATAAYPSNPAPAAPATTYPPTAAPAYPAAAAPQYGQQPAPGYGAGAAAPVGYAAAPEQGERHPIQIAPPVATEGFRLGGQVGPYFPMGDLSDDSKLGAKVGIGGRVFFGYEFMFDRFGVMPNIAVELANFGTRSVPLPTGDSSNDSVFYLGVQPGIRAALHLGHFAPYFGMTFGFDHYAASGKATDLLSAQGLKTDANGFGFGVLFGLDIVITPSVSAGMGFELHPGFTSLDPGNGASYDLSHAALLFGAAYHF